MIFLKLFACFYQKGIPSVQEGEETVIGGDDENGFHGVVF